MKLSEFTELLLTHPEKPFHLILPGQNTVPKSFHITEVGHVVKTFIDCGGKLHVAESCQLQAWVYTDNTHKLLAGKMAKILNIAKEKGILSDTVDLDVEIEYEAAAISQYTIPSYAMTDEAVVFHLEAKHTDCLAKELCVPAALPMANGTTPVACCAPGCCA